MTVYSVDSEASYADGRDIKALGVEGYVRHPDTDHYLCSIAGSDGFEWVGHPTEAPWRQIATGGWCSHNSAYDKSVIAEYRRRFKLDIPEPQFWHCTADMAAYLQSPRSLKDSCRELLGIELSKAVRDDMKGRNWSDLSPARQQDVKAYALDDARNCLELWLKYSDQWPENERGYSDHTAYMTSRGIGVDLEGVARGVARMEECIDAARKRIPWAGRTNAKGKEIPLTSPKELRLECERRGIPAPSTTDAKSELWQAWLDTYEEQADFIKGIQAHRRANRILKILEAMQRRAVGSTLPYGLKYGGATPTMRWAGDAGLNMHNFPRSAFEGVDLRSYLVPRPGKVLVVSDYSQIEARKAVWFGGDEALLNMIRGGMDLYEAAARRAGAYTDPRPLAEVNPKMRQYYKGAALGMQYGMGPGKYLTVANTIGKMSLSATEAEKAVREFRRDNPGIVKCWRKLDRGIAGSKGSRKFSLELPSGRAMQYMDLAEVDGEWSCRVERGSHRVKLYGAKSFENLCQASARDLLAEAVVSLEDAGLPVVLHVHDEVVVEVDADQAQEALGEVRRIMQTTPEWADGLPVAVDAKIMEKKYGK